MAKDRIQPVEFHESEARAIKPAPLEMVRGRREVLKQIGSGMALGLGAGALIGREQTAQGQEQELPQQELQEPTLQLVEPLPPPPGFELFASWIHGHTGHVQQPLTGLTVRAFGNRLDLFSTRNLGQNWVHYGIPTPVFVEGKRLNIFQVILNFFTTGNNARITEVHIYDGPLLILAQSNQQFVGPNPSQVFPIPGSESGRAVQFGIGVSLGFILAAGGTIQIYTVGADFLR